MKSKTMVGLMIAVMVAMVSISGCVQNDYLLKSVTEILSEDGGRVDWCVANNHIFYDSKYDMWMMEPDGSNRTCLTNGEFPGRYVGQPACSPNGQYILFQVEKEDHGNLAGKIPEKAREPGWGVHNELWVMKIDINNPQPLIEKWCLVNVSTGKGVLHSHFSKDGSKILWSEIITFDDSDPYTWEESKSLYEQTGELAYVTMKWALQDWRMKIADFIVNDGVPTLANITTLPRLPDAKILHEAHGFSPDGTNVLFASNDKRDASSWFAFDIYTYNLITGDLEQLTDTKDVWEEHAHYSPDGKKIIWSSHRGFDIGNYRREYWLMDEDGENKSQLTHFHTSGYPEYAGKYIAICCADNAWNKDGTSVAAFGWELNGITQEIKGKIYRLDFKEGLAKNITDLIDENGNRVDWSHKHDLIAISKTKENGI